MLTFLRRLPKRTAHTMIIVDAIMICDCHASYHAVIYIFYFLLLLITLKFYDRYSHGHTQDTCHVSGKLLSLLFDVVVLLLITTGTPHSYRYVHAAPAQSHTACTHTCALGDQLTDSLSLTQHHMHITSMIFHSVHYCNFDNRYITAYH